METSLRLTIAALGLAVFNVSAQTPAGLNLQLYAGLSITGAVGTVYSIEYVTDLSHTNHVSVHQRKSAVLLFGSSRVLLRWEAVHAYALTCILGPYSSNG